MRPSHKTNKSIFLIIGLITVIALAYSYYFFIYVRSNEKDIMETAYRRLESINQNMTGKALSYQQRFSTNLCQVEERQHLAKERETKRSELRTADKSEIDTLRAQIELLTEKIKSLSLGENETQLILEKHKSERRDYFDVVDHHFLDSHSNENDRFINNKISDEHFLKIALQGDQVVYYPLTKFLDDVLKSEYFNNLALLHCTDDCESPFSENIHTVFSSGMHHNSINELISKSKTLYDSNYFDKAAIDVTYQGKDYRILMIPAEIPEVDLYLMGLVDLTKIRQQARAIDPGLVLVLSLILVILVISYPFIKLKFLDKNERLGISDLYILGTSTILGFSLLLLIIILLSNRNANTYNKSEVFAKNTAHHIKGQFLTELQNLHDDLSIFQNKYSDRSDEVKSTPTINERYSNYFGTSMDSITHKEASYFVTNHQADIELIVSDQIYMNANISGRNYFQDAVRGRTIELEDGLVINGLESVYSYSSATQELIMSKTLGKDSGIIAVAAKDIQMLSRPILSPDIKFAFINFDGLALIHSEQYRNNRENIFLEISGSERLRDLVLTGAEGSVVGKYYDTEHMIYAVPIDGLDWSLVILKDMTNEKIREFSTATILMELTILWFFLVILITLVVRISTSHKSLLKKKIFSYYWLLPRKDESIYAKKVLFNTVVILLQIAAYWVIDNLLVALLTHLQVIILTSATNFYLLYDPPRSRFSALSGSGKPLKIHLSIHILLFALVTVGLFSIGQSITGAITIIITVLLVGFLLTFDKLIGRAKFAESYNMFLYTWLIAVTLVPTTSYYTIIADKELRVWNMASAYSIAQQLSPYSAEGNENLEGLINIDQVTVNTKIPDELEGSHISERSKEYSFMDGLRVNPQFLFPEYNNLPLTRMDKDLATREYEYRNNEDEGLATTILSENVKGSLDVWFKKVEYDTNQSIILIIVLMGIFLILSYRVINMISTRALNKGLDDLFIKAPVKFQDLSNISTEIKNLFFTTFEEETIEAWAKKTWPDIIVLNFQKTVAASMISAINNGAAETYLITGLDYNLINSSRVVERLRLIDELNAQKEKRIIVVSPVELEFIFDHYNQRIFQTSDAEAAHELMELKDQWESIFKNYSQIHVPLSHDNLKIAPQYKSEFEAIVAHETHHGTHLRSLQMLITSDICQDDKSLYISCCEKVIIQVQMLADAFYHNLWNNCTDSEKLLLFDLADDGVLNSSDTISLKNLYQKGLIVSGAKEGSHTPSIFNYSFSNFILESNIHKEAEALEKEFRKRGKWKNYSAVLVTVIVALVTFFVFAEPHQLERVNSIIAIMVAAIPGVIRIGQALFSFSLTKPSSK